MAVPFWRPAGGARRAGSGDAGSAVRADAGRAADRPAGRPHGAVAEVALRDDQHVERAATFPPPGGPEAEAAVCAAFVSRRVMEAPALQTPAGEADLGVHVWPARQPDYKRPSAELGVESRRRLKCAEKWLDEGMKAQAVERKAPGRDVAARTAPTAEEVRTVVRTAIHLPVRSTVSSATRVAAAVVCRGPPGKAHDRVRRRREGAGAERVPRGTNRRGGRREAQEVLGRGGEAHRQAAGTDGCGEGVDRAAGEGSRPGPLPRFQSRRNPLHSPGGRAPRARRVP